MRSAAPQPPTAATQLLIELAPAPPALAMLSLPSFSSAVTLPFASPATEPAVDALLQRCAAVSCGDSAQLLTDALLQAALFSLTQEMNLRMNLQARVIQLELELHQAQKQQQAQQAAEQQRAASAAARESAQLSAPALPPLPPANGHSIHPAEGARTFAGGSSANGGGGASVLLPASAVKISTQPPSSHKSKPHTSVIIELAPANGSSASAAAAASSGEVLSLGFLDSRSLHAAQLAEQLKQTKQVQEHMKAGVHAQLANAYAAASQAQANGAAAAAASSSAPRPIEVSTRPWTIPTCLRCAGPACIKADEPVRSAPAELPQPTEPLMLSLDATRDIFAVLNAHSAAAGESDALAECRAFEQRSFDAYISSARDEEQKRWQDRIRGGRKRSTADLQSRTNDDAASAAAGDSSNGGHGNKSKKPKLSHSASSASDQLYPALSLSEGSGLKNRSQPKKPAGAVKAPSKKNEYLCLWTNPKTEVRCRLQFSDAISRLQHIKLTHNGHPCPHAPCWFIGQNAEELKRHECNQRAVVGGNKTMEKGKALA